MLFPQSNPYRQVVDLSGFWDFRPDPGKVGEHDGWADGVPDSRPLAVPASWNDQYADLRDYLGDGWYQTYFDRPWGWDGKRVVVRFGSVNYLADVWLNGTRIGQHEGGHLPFEFDITGHVQPENNRLVVRVNGELAPDRVPPGAVGRNPKDSFSNLEYPPANFDFFPYCGIHRPVQLYAVPHQAIRDLTVTTDIDGARGHVHISLACPSGDPAVARFTLSGYDTVVEEEVVIQAGMAEVTLTVSDAKRWSPAAPCLYTLVVEQISGGQVIDRYTLPVGIRTVAVDGDQLLLNGEPVYLRGFGRHEDFALTGRGYLPVTIVKDYDLMRWIGANSFRTSHYPYSEQMMALADRLGVLVIDETPAVGLFFHQDGLSRRTAVWHQQIRELIDRDKNHPSVIMWSLANEPHNKRPPALQSFQDAFDLARSLDFTRPVTFVSQAMEEIDPTLEFCDVICLNRYDGWYTEVGQLEAGFSHLADNLDAIYEQYPRPVILCEFGADTIPGMHADPPEMFSEEYQAEMLAGFIRVLDARPYVVGQHVWNMCDFKTGQSVQRVGAMNYKGVFTRDRRPKLAAHRLRDLWRGDK